eukprot:7230935-Prymnesium_polylepis.1
MCHPHRMRCDRMKALCERPHTHADRAQRESGALEAVACERFPCARRGWHCAALGRRSGVLVGRVEQARRTPRTTFTLLAHARWSSSALMDNTTQGRVRAHAPHTRARIMKATERTVVHISPASLRRAGTGRVGWT